MNQLIVREISSVKKGKAERIVKQNKHVVELNILPILLD